MLHRKKTHSTSPLPQAKNTDNVPSTIHVPSGKMREKWTTISYAYCKIISETSTLKQQKAKEGHQVTKYWVKHEAFNLTTRGSQWHRRKVIKITKCTKNSQIQHNDSSDGTKTWKVHIQISLGSNYTTHNTKYNNAAQSTNISYKKLLFTLILCMIRRLFISKFMEITQDDCRAKSGRRTRSQSQWCVTL